MLTFVANDSYRVGRAYRHGDMVCGRIAIDLSPAEDRHATVRFLDPPAEHLGAELATLVQRRGAAARRAAEQLEPIELVVDSGDGPRRLAGRLEPPLVRFGRLRDIEFGVRVRSSA